jgi:acetoin utilization protein AcuB
VPSFSYKRRKIMRVGGIMRTHVVTVSPRESAEAAIERMRRARIRHLVVQDGEKVVGVVSDRDLPPGSPRRPRTVEDVMTSPAVTCSPHTTLREAANLLRGRAIGCLLVVAEGRVAGIVTTTDLLELIGTDLEERPVPKTRRWVAKRKGPEGKPVAGRGRTVRVPAPR